MTTPTGDVLFGAAVIPYQQVPVLPKLSAALGNVIAQIADALGFFGALAVVERTIVRHKRWLEPKEFVGLYAISQVLPGPTGISLCVLLGDRFF